MILEAYDALDSKYGLKTFECDRPSAVMIGKFDGFHLGHQKLLAKLQRLSEQESIASIVIAFDMVPLLQKKGLLTGVLMERSEKRAYLKDKVDYFVDCPFDASISEVQAEDFIRDELVAKLYNLFYRSIKVLPTGLGNVLKEAQSVTEETSRSYLITGGKASSMSRAVSGCVRIKQNISLAIMIQLIAVIAGIMIAATLSLYAGVGVMGSLEVFIYAVFWAAATLIAPSVQKP